MADEILKKVSGIHLARASKHGMMPVLYRIRRIPIRDNATRLGSITARVDDSDFVLLKWPVGPHVLPPSVCLLQE